LSKRVVPKRMTKFFSRPWGAAKSTCQKIDRFEVPGLNRDRSPCRPVGKVDSICHSEGFATAFLDTIAE